VRYATAIGATSRGRVVVTVRLRPSDSSAFDVAGATGDQWRTLRDRLRAAVLSSQLHWSGEGVAVDLLPTSRSSSVDPALDLPIAMAFLAASRQIDVEHLDERTFIGTLGLDGAIHAVPDLPGIASRADTAEVVVPSSAASEVRRALTGTEIRVVRSHHLANLVGVRWGTHKPLNESHEFDVFDEWDPYIHVIERAAEQCMETSDRLRRYFANAVVPQREFFHETARVLVRRAQALVELGQDLERALGRCGADFEVIGSGDVVPCTLPSGHRGDHARPLELSEGQRAMYRARDVARRALNASNQLGWLTTRTDRAAATGESLAAGSRRELGVVRDQLGQVAEAVPELMAAVDELQERRPAAEVQQLRERLDRMQRRGLDPPNGLSR
jgi:hypothetical protein